MKSTYASRPGASLGALPLGVVVLAVLGIGNILANRVLPAWSYVPWNVAVAAVVAWLGLRVRRRDELGLWRWRAGLRLGAAVAAVVLAAYVVAIALPTTRDLFRDGRVDDSAALLAYHVLIRIPIGTVLLEELAFRAVLPSLFTPRIRHTIPRAQWRGILTTSALFGLWHVLPAWNLGDVNPTLADMFGEGGAGQLVGVVLAVAGTFLAGVGLCLLRYRSGSVLAPAVVHVATNSGGYALAWLVTSGP